MRGVLVDTNAYGAFKEGRPEAVEILRHAPLIVLSTVVLGELLGGFAAGTKDASNREQLLQFLASERVRVFSVDSDTAESYAKLYLSLRTAWKSFRPDPWITRVDRNPLDSSKGF